MTIGEIVDRVDRGRVVSIARPEIDALLETAELIRKDNTGIAGSIRTLRVDDRVLVQERTPEGDHFIRDIGSVEAAGHFVEERLAAYERMWDG